MSDVYDHAHRVRIRELLPNLSFGEFVTGRLNSITDVPGVLVSVKSVTKAASKADDHLEVNTGFTVILPRREWFKQGCFAAIHSFNGSGEMTGSHWINESGLLNSPIVITNSFGVGACYDGVYKYARKHYRDTESGICDWFLTPVIAETFDGWLSDIGAMAVRPDDVVEGIDSANSNLVPEGCTGGGTGMITMGFKAGTGSASRSLDSVRIGTDGKEEAVRYTVGVLVQSNFGGGRYLTVKGVPVGKILINEAARQAEIDKEAEKPNKDTFAGLPERDEREGSIIIIIATDAPLIPKQLDRLVKRATIGMARTGGWGSNYSGDIFLAFSTAHEIPRNNTQSFTPSVPEAIPVLDTEAINALFVAAADATEEAICEFDMHPTAFARALLRCETPDNAICMAQDTKGPIGREVKAINLQKLKEIVERHAYVG